LDDTSLNVDGPFLEVILGVTETFSKIFAVGDQSTDFGSISEGLYKNSKTALVREEIPFNPNSFIEITRRRDI